MGIANILGPQISVDTVDPERLLFKTAFMVHPEFALESSMSDTGSPLNGYYYIPNDCQAIVAAAVADPNNNGLYSIVTELPGSPISLAAHCWRNLGDVPLTSPSVTPIGDPDIKLSEFTYDHRGRLLSETTRLNDGEPAVVTYGYDELGKLNQKSYNKTLNVKVNPDFFIHLYTVRNLPSDEMNALFSEILSRDYGIGNWEEYDYFKDGEINPAYGIKNHLVYAWPYYFPYFENFGNASQLRAVINEIKGRLDYIREIGFGIDSEKRPNEKFDRNLTFELSSPFVTETYDYNIQGWLTEKKSDVFDMSLRYHDPQQSGVAASYTGNITEWEWKHKGTGADDTPNTYAFTYDKLSRLKDTDHYTGTGATPANMFTERGLNYDANGNIRALKRYSDGNLVDDLSYEYDGNRLTSLTENAASPAAGWDVYERGSAATACYEYDSNGNMIHDERKSLDFTYNYLNLLGEARDSETGDLVTRYTFLADGRKVSAVNGVGNFGLEYLGSLAYKSVNGELQLESTAFDGGRIVASEGASGTVYTPNYHITDHLGSTRAVVANGEVIERSDFYPFGARHLNPAAAITDNRYRFSGKEDQDVFGLRLQDFGARMYDAPIGRWWSTDPLAEKYYPVSPYAYCANNPIKFVDSDGRDVWEISKNGEIINRKHTNKHDVFYMVDEIDGQWQRMQYKGADIYISFKYGTIESQKKQTSANGTPYDVYQVRGDENGTALFEFMANNTIVEWSQAKTGIAGDKGLNFLTTSHNNDTERGMKSLYIEQLYAGYTIREMNHSHPNSDYPSGLIDRNLDIGFARMVAQTQQQNRLAVPAFGIYHVPSNQMIQFNHNSRLRDFIKFQP